MRKYSTICLGCMQEKGQAQVCPFCGYHENTLPLAPHYLEPGTMLAGKYLIGRGLGHGGFGTTYIARDQVLGIKLAIKEYLPQDCAARSAGTNMVHPYSGDGTKRFAQGLESFLQEARTLARFDGSQNIVGVRDFFTENGTAYLVMNYLEGITLKQYLVRSGGKPVPFNSTMGMLMPVMDALKTVHAAGLLHRDVSPDNIFLTTSGQVMLIDFGAARQSMNIQQSMSVILKPGYAPEEQYRSRGNQGPWTDIYALGATMYRTLTGIIPSEALERMGNDDMVSPSQMGIRIPPYAEAAILRAMAVRAQDRFQTIDEFQSALLNGGKQPAPAPRVQQAKPQPANQQARAGGNKSTKAQGATTNRTTTRKKKKKRSRPFKIVLTILMLILIAFVVLFFVYISLIMGSPNDPSFALTDSPTSIAEETPANTPAPSPTPSPSVDFVFASPSATITEAPVDEKLRPFIEGTMPNDAISTFVPASGRIMVVKNEDAETIWVTGQAPMMYPNLLSAQFIYNDELGLPDSTVYAHYLDEDGNLRYVSLDENPSDVLVLPANCAVGMSFNGILGSSKVYAVNYSGRVGGMKVSNSIVIQSDSGYAFYQVGKGLLLVQSGFESGTVSYQVVSDERDETNIYKTFVE